MATYKKGILGVFSGKLGTVIGSTWKGVDYMRSLPKASSKAASQLQIDQRMRFTMINEFFKPIKALVATGFQSVVGSITPMNAAVSYHLKTAIIGASPNFNIDYAKVLFSRGELVSPSAPAAVAGAAGIINFTWQDNTRPSYAEATDQAVLLVYNATSSEFVVLESPATRATEAASLTVPPNFSGTAVHCWMSYFAADRRAAATSMYLGTVTVA